MKLKIDFLENLARPLVTTSLTPLPAWNRRLDQFSAFPQPKLITHEVSSFCPLPLFPSSTQRLELVALLESMFSTAEGIRDPWLQCVSPLSSAFRVSWPHSQWTLYSTPVKFLRPAFTTLRPHFPISFIFGLGCSRMLWWWWWWWQWCHADIIEFYSLNLWFFFNCPFKKSVTLGVPTETICSFGKISFDLCRFSDESARHWHNVCTGEEHSFSLLACVTQRAWRLLPVPACPAE